MFKIAVIGKAWLRLEAEQCVIVVGGLPVHHYRADDAVAEAYAMVFLVESGFAQQSDVERAFGPSARTVRRHQERYARGGMAALGREEGWRPGRRRVSAKRLRSIEALKSQGLSNRAVAHLGGHRGCLGLAAGSTVKSVRPSTACVRRYAA